MTDPRDRDTLPGEATLPADATLDDEQLQLVLLLVDGELDGEQEGKPRRRAEAEALLAASAVARAIADDWRAAKGALREAVLTKPVTADLTMVRGRVLTKLPAEPRAPVAAETETGLWSWLRKLGFGKVSIAVGVAAAAAVWLVMTSTGQLGRQAEEAAAPAVAARPALQAGATGEPSVIIEDMEIDSGTVLVRPGAEAGEATIIWHFAEGQGAG